LKLTKINFAQQLSKFSSKFNHCFGDEMTCLTWFPIMCSFYALHAKKHTNT